MAILHTLHGNAGHPEDLYPLLGATGMAFHAWHLWKWLRENPSSASFEGFAAALEATAANRPRVLLGYSLGARLALYTLARNPGAWEGAVLLSVHPGLTTEHERTARLAADQSWAQRFRLEPWPGLMQAWDAQPVLAGKEVPRGTRSSLEEWRLEIANAFEVWSLARQPDLRSLFSSIPCPVLWITGGNDTKFTALAAEGSSLMPCGLHAVIPSAGHRVHWDQPALAGEQITDFLNSLPNR